MTNKPDLLVLIAIWQFITAFITVIGIAAIVIFAFPAVMNNNYWGYGDAWSGYYYGNMPMMGGIFGLSIAILVLVCYLGLSIAGGIGLIMGREWGRIIGLVHNALSLFAIPIGTVIGTLAIIYLTKQEVRAYFLPPKTPVA
jgi:hypothetical protein